MPTLFGARCCRRSADRRQAGSGGRAVLPARLSAFPTRAADGIAAELASKEMQTGRVLLADVSTLSSSSSMSARCLPQSTHRRTCLSQSSTCDSRQWEHLLGGYWGLVTRCAPDERSDVTTGLERVDIREVFGTTGGSLVPQVRVAGPRMVPCGCQATPRRDRTTLRSSRHR